LSPTNKGGRCVGLTTLSPSSTEYLEILDTQSPGALSFFPELLWDSKLVVLFCVLFVCQCVLYYCQQVSTNLQLTNISYYIKCNSTHRQILALITHCTACSMPHGNFTVPYVCQPKCWLHLLFRPFYKNDQKHAFRILPEVTALNNCFLGRRRCQHHSAHGDCTSRKRRLMQHCLCCLWRYHCSNALCCSYWWGQRCLPGNRIMIRINIYI